MSGKQVNIFGSLVGVIFVLLANLPFLSGNEFVVSLLLALGTALFAACFVNIALALGRDKEPAQPLELLADERIDLARFYRKRRAEAQCRHDLLSIAVAGALRDIAGDDELIDRILRRRLKVRLLFLNPESPYVAQRAVEDQITPEDVYRELSESVALAVRIGEKIRARHAELRTNRLLNESQEGSFEVRLYDGSPYMTLFRVDDELVWGLYTSEKRGIHSPAFRTRRGESALAEQLEGHFNVLWERAKSTCLVRYLEQNDPVVYTDLADRLRAGIARRLAPTAQGKEPENES